MVDYCTEYGYSFDIVDDGLDRKEDRFIPFIRALRKHRQQINAFRSFLALRKPDKLVFVRRAPKTRLAIKEANYAGVSTVVLQWSFIPPQGHYCKPPSRTPLHFWLYGSILYALRGLLDLITSGLRYVSMPWHTHKVGVISEMGRIIHPEKYGDKPETIEVVGNIEFLEMKNLAKCIQDQPKLKAELKKKYNIDPLQNVVVIFSMWPKHYVHHQVTHTQEEEDEQVQNFAYICKSVRAIYGNDVQIIFKMKPSEKNIYTPLEEYGVAIWGDKAFSDELVAIADLCILGPGTSVNYLVTASGRDAIFFNFSSIVKMNETAAFFNINHVVNDHDEFIEKLKLAKARSLPLQYDHATLDMKSIDTLISFLKL